MGDWFEWRKFRRMESMFESWAVYIFFDIRLQVNHILSHFILILIFRDIFHLRHFAHKRSKWTFHNDSFQNVFWIKRSKIHNKKKRLFYRIWAEHRVIQTFFGNERSKCNEHFHRQIPKFEMKMVLINSKKQNKNCSSGTTNKFCILNMDIKWKFLESSPILSPQR